MEIHLTATECHLPYGITQCYLSPDTSNVNVALLEYCSLLDRSVFRTLAVVLCRYTTLFEFFFENSENYIKLQPSFCGLQFRC